MNALNGDALFKETVRRLRMDGLKLAQSGKNITPQDVERTLNEVASASQLLLDDIQRRHMVESIKNRALSIPSWLTGYFLDRTIYEIIITGPANIVLRRSDGHFDASEDAFEDPLHLLYSLNMLLRARGTTFSTQNPGTYVNLEDQAEIVILMPPLAESQILVSIRLNRRF